jgi:hypothetical protein
MSLDNLSGARMSSMQSRTDLVRVVRTAAVDLTSWSEAFSDAHIHFDDPMFAGLVPDFADVEWLSLASMAAEAVADVSGSFLIQVPIGEWEHVPERFDLTSLDTLRPWQPPSIHLLRKGVSLRDPRQPPARRMASRCGATYDWRSRLGQRLSRR